MAVLRRDDAISEVIGVVLMIGLAVTLAGILFFWVGFGDEMGEAPIAIGLNAEKPPFSDKITYVVSAVSAPTNWSDISLQLDGRKLTYDDTLTGAAKFCVVRGGDSCVPALSWNGRLQLEAGQLIRLRDDSLEGREFTIVHLKSNGLAARLTVPTEAL